MTQEGFCPTCDQPLSEPWGLEIPFKRKVIWRGQLLPLSGQNVLVLWILRDQLGNLVTYEVISKYIWGKRGAPAHQRDIMRKHVDKIRLVFLAHDVPFKIITFRGEGFTMLPKEHAHGTV